MKETKGELAEQKIIDFLNSLNCELDLIDYVDTDEMVEYGQMFDDIYDYIYESGICNTEVIYYADAMDYLNENDLTLNEVMGLASELGYKTENLNSCLLATILKQRNLQEEVNGLQAEIDEFLQEVYDDLDDDEDDEEDEDDEDDE